MYSLDYNLQATTAKQLVRVSMLNRTKFRGRTSVAN